ncbi:importin subunit alpha-1a-like [Malania oleifera]|uniref:importin subunit alpha-1a-like n=1 Tax=Malania oleifera TaxID=397392 RepID=UPI0025ADAE19|nr:importin subunit alpha-1a-like [Malania oleifera]
MAHTDIAPSPRSTNLGNKVGAFLVILTIFCVLFRFILHLIAKTTHSKEGQQRTGEKINIDESQKSIGEESLQKKHIEGLQAQQLESLPSLVAGVQSDERSLQLEATMQIRRLLSKELNPPIEEVVQSGVVPRLVEFLSSEDFPKLQYEAAWALTNIASGTWRNTKVVIDHGAVPIFIKLLASSNDDVREQAAWALGNVAGDSARTRDLVLSQGALMPLLAQLYEHDKLSMLRTASWTLSNFCRGKPEPEFERVKPAIPVLKHLVHANDEVVLTNACWALSYISGGQNKNVQAIIEAGFCPHLVELLLHPTPSVLSPVLLIIGNIVTGDDSQTQCIIDHGALPCLLNLLTCNYEMSIMKSACWAISNITAGNREQIQAVIDAGLIGPLVNLLQNANLDVQKEAALAIANAAFGCTQEQMKHLVSQGCIKPLCDLLECSDQSVVSVSLAGLEYILEAGEAEKNLGRTGDTNYYAQLIDDVNGTEKIVNLLYHHDDFGNYKNAERILKTYWTEEEEEEEEEDEESTSEEEEEEG